MAELKSITHLDDNGKPPAKPAEVGHHNLAFLQMNPEFQVPPSLRQTPNIRQGSLPFTRGRVVKNILVVSFGFLLLFTAFQSLSNLQSSLNSDEGLGTASLAVIYAALVVSCMFVPSPMISALGLKTTIWVSMLLYGVYFVANFHASWYTLIPASVILGLGGAPLWTAKCAYLTKMAARYAEVTEELTETMVVRFFGIFFMVFQTGQVWGNLIAYGVLKPEEQNDIGNLSETTSEVISLCGIDFCDAPSVVQAANNTNLERPADSKVFVLCGIYTGCALLAALMILLGLDPIEQTRDPLEIKRGKFRLLAETIKHLRKPYQLIIIPLTIFSGLEQAFIAGDFTKAYVTCSWGVHNVGYVMICFGITDAACSFAFGPISKHFGRVTVFTLGVALNAAGIALMFFWQGEGKAIYFVIAALWGAGDAVWQTQINSLYGVLFPDDREAAFANYRLWESLGFIIAFAYSSHLCINVKLYILIGCLAVGFLGYLCIELHSRKSKQEQKEKYNEVSTPHLAAKK